MQHGLAANVSDAVEAAGGISTSARQPARAGSGQLLIFWGAPAALVGLEFSFKGCGPDITYAA